MGYSNPDTPKHIPEKQNNNSNKNWKLMWWHNKIGITCHLALVAENQNKLKRGAYAIEDWNCEGQGAVRHRVTHGSVQSELFQEEGGGGESSIKRGAHQGKPEQQDNSEEEAADREEPGAQEKTQLAQATGQKSKKNHRDHSFR